MRERERRTDRDKNRDTDTDRQTDRQTDTESQKERVGALLFKDKDLNTGRPVHKSVPDYNRHTH